jgi:predicted PhzF superfamily epimerase YddE/YHI9
MNFYIVDCFAEQKYQGNQLAVFIPDHELTTEEMQQIAREINFSETTFILSGKQANGNLAGYLLRHDVFGSRNISYSVSQGAEIGRPSTLRIRAAFDGETYNIEVGGNAFLVAKGTWL